MKGKLIIALSLVGLLMTAASCKKNDTTSTGNNPAPGTSITGIDCSSGSFSATALVNIAYSGTATVPYSGGNGVAYTAGTAITSTGVTGLTATLMAGTLSNGNGNLSYSVTGLATTSGVASFAISFAGKSCTLNLNVLGTAPILPAVFNQIYGASSITFDGTYVTIKTNDQPDHKSIYWPTTNPLYETFSGPTFAGYSFAVNPNKIISQNITLKIPAFPVVAATHQSTPMGVIGVAIDGVPFFNQYAAGGTQIDQEIHSFDQSWAHPQQTGVYHYHVEPLYLTTVKGRSALLGFLLDGFPVYGPDEAGGAAPTGLDVYHGHTHATADYPGGIYHYHFTAAAPYLNGNGFYGTPGTVTQ